MTKPNGVNVDNLDQIMQPGNYKMVQFKHNGLYVVRYATEPGQIGAHMRIVLNFAVETEQISSLDDNNSLESQVGDGFCDIKFDPVQLNFHGVSSSYQKKVNVEGLIEYAIRHPEYIITHNNKAVKP